MAKEEKPLEYQRRIRDTKGVAQRLDLDYLKRPALMLVLRKRVTWIAVGVAAMLSVPLVVGIGGSRRTLSTGPLSSSHAVFEGRCEVCHAQAFSRIPDAACERCHDGAAHPANLVDTARANVTPACAECHMEHNGAVRLGQVANSNCTRCHGNLNAHARNVKIKGVEVSAFRERSHPAFSAASVRDIRPLQLNHKKHMPDQPSMFRGMKLPMKCTDCHVTDLASPTGALIPMTFEKNCKPCHAQELQFDIYQVLGAKATASPHTRDANTIKQFISNAYHDALAADPTLPRKPLGNDLNAQPGADAWIAKVTQDSYNYLFEKKCPYCHQMESYAVVKKVDPTSGRYPEGKPWLERSEFSHRSHREVECDSCHVKARTSTKTEDVLIPEMKSCLPCHGDSRAGLDRCSECHLYHNRSLEKEHERRPTEKIVGMHRSLAVAALYNSRATEPRPQGSGAFQGGPR